MQPFVSCGPDWRCPRTSALFVPYTELSPQLGTLDIQSRPLPVNRASTPAPNTPWCGDNRWWRLGAV
eukprot:10019031-Heterocapsa_arctica.AAC.1